MRGRTLIKGVAFGSGMTDPYVPKHRKHRTIRALEYVVTPCLQSYGQEA